VRIVEVKSENDRLSGQQRAWIELMLGAGIAVEVCKVSPAGEEPEHAIR
jgi:Fanconi-associated nuclease 1